jgi:hypothetical protein
MRAVRAMLDRLAAPAKAVGARSFGVGEPQPAASPAASQRPAADGQPSPGRD